jgi:hypothetical protein
MTTHGGYTMAKIEARAGKRNATVEAQLEADTRTGAERARIKGKRGYIAPPEPKQKMAAGSNAPSKKKR